MILTEHNGESVDLMSLNTREFQPMPSSSVQFVRIQDYTFNLALVAGFRKSRHDRSLVISEVSADPVRITFSSVEERDRVYEELCDLTNLVDLSQPVYA